MSLITHQHRLSVKEFAAVPAVLDLPEIQRDAASVSDVSPRSSKRGGIVDLEEGCLITKSVKYVHQLVHWVNAVCSGDPGPAVSQKFQVDPPTAAEQRFLLVTGEPHRARLGHYSISALHPRRPM